MADHKVHVKQKLFRKQKRAYPSSWSRRGNQKLFTLTNPQNLAKPVKIFLGIIVRRHLKRWYFLTRKEKLFFQSQMDESNPLEEIRNWENTHHDTGTPNSRRKSKGFSTRIRGVSSSDRINRWRWSPCRLLVDSRWLHLSSSQWTSSSTLCAEGRNIPYPTEMHWYNQVYLHWSGRHARETCRWLLESIRTEACQIRGKVSQNSLYRKKNLTRVMCGPGRQWQKFKRPQDQIACGQKYGRKLVNLPQNRNKQEWKNEKPKRDNARRLRGFFLFLSDDQDYKETQKCEE